MATPRIDQEIVDEIMRLYRDGMSIPNIAAAVGKHRMHVGRIIKRVQRDAEAELKAVADNKAGKVVEPPKKMTPTEARKVAEAKRREEWRNNTAYRKIQKMFSEEDADYFMEQWEKYEKQLVDMTPAEEDMLEKLLILDLRLIHNQQSMKDAQKVIEQLRKDLGGRDKLDVENELDLQIHATINTTNQYEIELNKQYSLLIKEYNVLQEKLNATRQQREQNAKVGAETFVELMQKLSTEEFRRRVGEQNELMKRAVKQKTDQWQRAHKYVDGQYDLPILDGAHVKKIKEAEEKAKQHDIAQLEGPKENNNGG